MSSETLVTSVPQTEEVISTVLAKINTDVWDNYRTNMFGKSLDSLEKSIDSNGLMVPPTGAMQEDGTIGVVAGFCRVECLRRLALKKVVKAYNNAFDLKDDEAINYRDPKSRVKVREAGDEWKAKYDKALLEYEVPVRLMKVDSKAEAALLNMVENTERQNTPLADDMLQIERLLTEFKITAKELSKRSRFSQPVISVYRKINGLRKFLEENYFQDLTEFGLDDEATEALELHVKTCLNEWDRRLKLNTDDETGQAIKYHHARSFAFFAQRAASKFQISAAGVLEALEKLTCVERYSKQHDNSDKRLPTPDSTFFTALLAEIEKREEKLLMDSAVAATEGEAAEGEPEAETLTAEDVAAAGTEEAVSTGNEVAAETTETAGEAESPVEETSADVDDLMDSITDDESPAVAAKEESDENGEEDEIDDGATGRTVKKRGIERYRVQPAEDMEKRARDMVRDAFDEIHAEALTVVDQSAFLLAGNELIRSLGMDRHANVLSAEAAKFMSASNAYVRKLEEIALEALGDDNIQEVEALKPSQPVINWAELDAALIKERQPESFA